MYTAILGRRQNFRMARTTDLQVLAETEPVRLADDRRTKIAVTIFCSIAPKRNYCR